MSVARRGPSWPWVLAVVYAVAMSTATGLIPAWGRWYPVSPHHGDQVNALLRGGLALSHDPAALRLDLAWAQGGVQQVWGLGVPLWRLAPEAALRLLGGRDFPGRLAFAAALAVAAWLVTSSLREHRAEGTGRRGHSPTGWFAACGVLLLLCYPPFVSLLRSRFDIREEVIAYGYVWGLALIAGLVRLSSRPTVYRFGLVGALAGCGGLVRPTLVLHGIGILVAAGCLLAWRHEAMSARQRRRALTLGLGLFLTGNAVLYATNHARFGSGLSFGHELNVQFLSGSLYATRFDHPYAHEPFRPAARELFGLLFRVRNPGDAGFYSQDLFPGQSATLRWREIYLTTYNPLHLILMLGGGALTAWRGRRLRPWGRRATGDDDLTITPEAATAAALAVYGIISAALLAAFYLRSPVISSRYLLDLMPSFAALLLAGCLSWCTLWRQHRRGNAVLASTMALMAVWLIIEYRHADVAAASPRVLTRTELAGRRPARETGVIAMPECGCYEAAGEPARTGIPYNGSGWWAPNGEVQSCIILFVDDPAYLELSLAARESDATPEAPTNLRAKVGREYLVQESTRRTDDGWTIRFAGPRLPRFRRGLQPVFIATVTPDHLADRETPWRLLRARWRAAPAPVGG